MKNAAIAVGLLVASCAIVSASETNLIRNGGFESPAGDRSVVPENWFYFSSHGRALSVDADTARSGRQSLRLDVQRQPHAHVGLAQKVSVEPGGRYIFRAEVLNDREEPLGQGVYGELGIEWLDARGVEISRESGRESWNRTLSRVRWERFEMKERAPADAVAAHFVIHLHDGPRGADARGRCYVDDVEVIEDEEADRAKRLSSPAH